MKATLKTFDAHTVNVEVCRFFFNGFEKKLCTLNKKKKRDTFSFHIFVFKIKYSNFHGNLDK